MRRQEVEDEAVNDRWALGQGGLFVLLRNLVYVLWRMEAIHSKPLYWVVTGSNLHAIRITLVWSTECVKRREALWGKGMLNYYRGEEGLTQGTKWPEG